MKESFYFSHDSNARNDEKILAVRMRFGVEGYGIYFMLIERMREESDYMSIKDYNSLAFDFRVSADKVKSIVEDFGLFSFTEDGKRFYSESFMKRMTLKDEKSRKRSIAGKKGMASRWKDHKKEQKSNNVTDSDSNVITNVEKNVTSKRKESKVNIKKTLSNERVKESEPAKRDSHALLSAEEKSNLQQAEEKIPLSPSCAPPLPPVGADAVKKTRARFIPPGVEEVRLYIAEKGYEVDAEAFVAFYTSKDWYVGRNKMKNWRAALVTWHKRPRLPDSGRFTQNYNYQNDTAYGTHISSDPEGDARKAYIARKAAKAVAECNSRGC